MLCLQENEVNIGRFVIYLLLLFQFGVTLHVFKGNPHRCYFAIGMLHKKGKLVSSLSLWFSSECPSVKRVTLGCC